jgi:hypothetical protein
VLGAVDVPEREVFRLRSCEEMAADATERKRAS